MCFKEETMETIKAKLLKDLSYISKCKLKKGQTVFIKKFPDNTNWVVDPETNFTIKLFSHEFEKI